MFKKRIGLALGGGGAKGLAHIGVLKFLEETKIGIDYVAGTSIGAIIGALHCLGYNADEIKQIAEKIKVKKLLDPTFPKKGLIKGDKLETYLRKIFENKKFSDLKKPMFVVATDIKNFQEVIFNKGDLAKAVRASISIPGIFHPVINNKRILVDGGILENLPIKVLKNQNVKKIIAVNLEKEKINNEIYDETILEKDSSELPSIFETLSNSYAMIDGNQIKNILENSDNSVLVISPDLKGINIQDFNKAKKIYQIGYNCAKNNHKKINSLIQKDNIFKKIRTLWK